MFARVFGASVVGVNGIICEVETHLSGGLPAFIVVGLPEGAVKESKERVQSAIAVSGFSLPPKRIRVNLAPADIRKEGSGFDLPIALGILAASGQIEQDRLKDFMAVGELSLEGGLRPVKGVLSVAIAAREGDFKGVLVPAGNGGEAALVDGLFACPVTSLSQAVAFLNGREEVSPAKPREAPGKEEQGPDFFEVRGQSVVKRALEVAAAGGHNVLMVGPPGSGKTMLAERLPTILPPLAFEEALDTTRIHSVAGTLDGTGLVTRRPFRAPHHTLSEAGLVGGGANPRPGEVSLAHNGVLFLDELPEFSRAALETLRQPMESGRVVISRAQATVEYPARFSLVAAMNPCPCGYYTTPRQPCGCTPHQIARYHSRVSGPLMDRIDIQIEVPSLDFETMSGSRANEGSEAIKKRVVAARQVQEERFEKREDCVCNGQMGRSDIDTYCVMGSDTRSLLERAVERFRLSARGYFRVLRLARTIADLEGGVPLAPSHVAEAVQYRSLDRRNWSIVR